MDDVRGDFLGPPHGTTPAAIIASKNKTVKKTTNKQDNKQYASRAVCAYTHVFRKRPWCALIEEQIRSLKHRMDEN